MESILAAAIVFLIQLKDKNNFTLRGATIEAALCGLLSLGVSKGIDGDIKTLAGGLIGCIGFSNSVDAIKRRYKL